MHTPHGGTADTCHVLRVLAEFGAGAHLSEGSPGDVNVGRVAAAPTLVGVEVLVHTRAAAATIAPTEYSGS